MYEVADEAEDDCSGNLELFEVPAFSANAFSLVFFEVAVVGIEGGSFSCIVRELNFNEFRLVGHQCY